VPDPLDRAFLRWVDVDRERPFLAALLEDATRDAMAHARASRAPCPR
jgi:hypothetical protein